MGKMGPALLFVFLLAGCGPAPVQYPPGVPPDPSQLASPSSPGTQPQLSGSQRWQYAWNKAMEGVAMGGSIGGPYGAGGGLVIGLITGLLTADSHFAQLNAQIQTEQAKDRELEAQLERELERQRELEAQLGKPGILKEPIQAKNQPVGAQIASQGDKSLSTGKREETGSLASLGRKESRPGTPTTSFKNVEIRDVNQDGVPDLWIYYHPLKPGEIVRQEEDTNGDGRVDTWSTFHDGKLVRREVDTKRTGRPDTIYYYEGEKISREERDEKGDGHPTFRAFYQNGRLAKVEKDLDHDGKMDLWIYYDTTKEEELVLKEERDLNGDGVIDLWSYYENGRLSRRDLSAVGLEVLSKQEEIPASPVNIQKIPLPGS